MISHMLPFAGFRRKVRWSSSIALILCSPIAAASLTAVPFQGSYPNQGTAMVHISFLFLDQPTGSLSATIDPVVPELTPLFVSNPADTFDPAYPWAAILERKAFSRRYGFVVSDQSDFLPSGHSIWIRHLQATPGLEAYRYRAGSTPAASEFTGIFGTNGSGDTLQWNLSMFHPTYVVPIGPGTTYTARYEAFVVDGSGQRVGTYTPVEFTLVFTKHSCATHLIWADADADNDVDQDDFGVFQLCLAGTSAPIPSIPIWCHCMDRDGDAHIAGSDLLLLRNCRTGPTINWSAALSPECAD